MRALIWNLMPLFLVKFLARKYGESVHVPQGDRFASKRLLHACPGVWIEEDA